MRGTGPGGGEAAEDCEPAIGGLVYDLGHHKKDIRRMEGMLKAPNRIGDDLRTVTFLEGNKRLGPGEHGFPGLSRKGRPGRGKNTSPSSGVVQQQQGGALWAGEKTSLGGW